eukprot:Awhi_evm1s705
MKELGEKSGYKRAYVDGGSVIHQFLKERLITEMTLSHLPMLLGSGIPLFTGDDSYKEMKFSLVSSKAYHNGTTQTVYKLR